MGATYRQDRKEWNDALGVLRATKARLGHLAGTSDFETVVLDAQSVYVELRDVLAPYDDDEEG